MINQRHQFRTPISRVGLVTKGTTAAVCELLDITEQGLHFVTTLSLALNETVRLECQLDADCIIHCGIFVTHSQPPHFGGRIVHLLPEHQQQLERFIQRLIIASMAGL